MDKGETLKDTALTLEAMGVDVVVIRHWAAGSAFYLSKLVKSSVINAGDGRHAHPTQALLDLYTLKKAFGSLKDLKLAIVGDIAHSRVARSLIEAAKKVGIDITIVAPPTFLPAQIGKLGVKIEYDLDKVLPNINIIYLLRLQLERHKQHYLPSSKEYRRIWGLTLDRWSLHQERLKIMHPGPLNRGVEIDSGVADNSSSLIVNQVSSGVAVRMAVLYWLLGGIGDN
jgi:aspartate carbamoyltransferase catalytic subunit